MGSTSSGRERRQRLSLEALGVDALIVSALPNIRYLTGFTGSNALLWIAAGAARLFTDPRYTTQASQECDCQVTTVRGKSLEKAVSAVIERTKARRIGFESARITWRVWNSLRESLPLKAELIPVEGAVEHLRLVKSPDEIEKIRASVELNSEAYQRALGRFRLPMTENELAAEIDFQMRKLGASGPAFDTIIASGANSALPHARPSSLKIQENRLLLIDMGADLDGYASDMTRTVAVGRISRRWKLLYNATLEAQLAAIDAVRPGVMAASVDRAARKVLARHGLAEAFIHSTGHGLGLEIHEMPRLGKADRTPLEAGMAITVEPGVYLPGEAGVRIEDTVLVTAHGCEVLTPTTKELQTLE
jgi:Xaa-Pro aminopeptidase